MLTVDEREDETKTAVPGSCEDCIYNRVFIISGREQKDVLFKKKGQCKGYFTVF